MCDKILYNNKMLLYNIHTVKHIYISFSSIVGIQLHWVQLHVSALYTGHRQVVLELVKELYIMCGVFWGCGGGAARSRCYSGGWNDLGHL